MPSISQKGHKMPPSPIRKLVPFAEQAVKQGKKIFYLNIGQPDIATPEIALETLRAADLKVIEYSHSAGFESYRRKLAGYYQSNGIQVGHENMIITTGGSEAILFGLMSCLDEGDEVIIPEPFYANYNGFAIAAGLTIRPVTANIDNGFALPPIEDFEKLITPKTKAIIICNPNNPTGYLYEESELQALRSLVLKHDLFLFADEVYREFCYDGHRHHSVLNLEGLEEHAVVVDSVSKRYSECGVRIGALVTRNQEVLNTVLKFAQARLSPPTLGQIVAEASIDVDDSYFKGVKAEYISRRDMLVQGLNAIDGVFCPNPGGAFYTIARLPIDDADRFSQWMLESFSHNDQSVMMAPASGFYASPGLGKNEVRIAYVLNKDDLQQALVCLEEGLKAYPGRTEAPVVTTSENGTL